MGIGPGEEADQAFEFLKKRNQNKKNWKYTKY
jgi:hypothetical protein